MTPFQYLRVLLATLVAPMVVWVIPVLQIIRGNAEYFNGHIDGGVLFFILALGSVGVSLLLFCLSEKSKLFSILFYSWLAVPVLWLAYSMLFVSGQRWQLYLIPLIALTLGWVIARNDAWKEGMVSVSAMFGFLLMINLVEMNFGIQTAAAKLRAEVEAETEAQRAQRLAKTQQAEKSKKADSASAAVVSKPSSLPDIYHIVFDEFQTDYFKIILDSQLKESLAGFTWFPNAFTPSGRTDMALPAVLSGVPYSYDQLLYDYIDDGFGSEQSLHHRLKQFGYSRTGFLHKIYPHGGVSRFDETFMHQEVGNYLDQEARRQLVPVLWSYKFLPKKISERLIPPRQFEQLETQSLLPDDAPYASLQSFRKFLEEERSREDKGGRYTFHHYLIPHFPDVLSDDCSYTLGMTTKKKEQARCAAKLIEELVQMLKEEGRFDDSLIVIHGDHGGSHSIKKGKLVKGSTDVFSEEFSWARSKSLVLIKPPSAETSNALKTDPRLVDLYDIYPTILDVLAQPASPKMVGSSLIASAASKPRKLYYHMYEKNYTIRQQVNEGPISRYLIKEDGISFEKKIEVPKVKKS